MTAYRAVATAAAREVRNYRRLMERIQRKSGIELEVISSEEEARLVCSAVHWALGDRVQPRLIFDLGGGSLELNFFERGVLRASRGAAAGHHPADGNLFHRGRDRRRQGAAAAAPHAVAAAQRDAVASEACRARSAVACGGNAEALVRLAPGPLVGQNADNQRAAAEGSDLADAADWTFPDACGRFACERIARK